MKTLVAVILAALLSACSALPASSGPTGIGTSTVMNEGVPLQAGDGTVTVTGRDWNRPQDYPEANGNAD